MREIVSLSGRLEISHPTAWNQEISDKSKGREWLVKCDFMIGMEAMIETRVWSRLCF